MRERKVFLSPNTVRRLCSSRKHQLLVSANFISLCVYTNKIRQALSNYTQNHRNKSQLCYSPFKHVVDNERLYKVKMMLKNWKCARQGTVCTLYLRVPLINLEFNLFEVLRRSKTSEEWIIKCISCVWFTFCLLWNKSKITHKVQTWLCRRAGRLMILNRSLPAHYSIVSSSSLYSLILLLLMTYLRETLS